MNEFSIKESIRFGWSCFKENFKFFLALALVVLVVSSGLTFFYDSTDSILFPLDLIVNLLISIIAVKIGIDAVDREKMSFLPLSQFILSWEVIWKFVVVNLIVMAVIFGVFAIPILAFIFTTPDLFSGIFSGGNFVISDLRPLLWPAIVSLFFVGLSAYLNLRLFFTSYLVVDRKLGPIKAIKKSWQMSEGYVLSLLAFVIAIGLVNLLGVMALGIGLLVSVPVTLIATAWVYRHFVPLSAEERAEEEVEDLLEEATEGVSSTAEDFAQETQEE